MKTNFPKVQVKYKQSYIKALDFWMNELKDKD